MKMKSFRFAAAAAVLLALALVFVAPVVAADTDIIKVGVGQTNATWSAAVANATDSDGDGAITYEIYGKVEVDKTGWVSPRGSSGATTINFVGMTNDAELCIPTATNTVIATDGISNMQSITFKDLICSRTAGAWVGDTGHANNYFTTWMRGATSATVIYTNCVFPNGTCNNQYGYTEYTGCTFNNPTEYALWIYGGEVIVTDGTFNAKKGVKIYNELNAAVTTKISDSTFNIESKPAVVSSAKGTVTLVNVNADACKYGIISSEAKEHNVANGLAAITVDGKEPVYAAVVNGEYHSSLEYAKEENRGEILTPVAKIEDKQYFSLDDAIAAAESDDTICPDTT